MNRLICCMALMLCLSSQSIWGQETFEEFEKSIQAKFEGFEKSVEQEYEDFRKKVNEEYADFMRKAWKEFNALQGDPIPEDKVKPIPPVVHPDNDRKELSRPLDRPIVIQNLTTPVVTPTPQPQPIKPIKTQPQPQPTLLSVTMFGTSISVPWTKEVKTIRLQDPTERAVSDAWKKLSKDPIYNNLTGSCLNIRDEYTLCDWSYLQFLDKVGQSVYPHDTNMATLLTAYLFCQSGYKMRLARGERLYLLFGSEFGIYELIYFKIDNERFYPLNCKENRLKIFNQKFPKEQSMSMQIVSDPQFSKNLSETRTLRSKRYEDVKADVVVNKNLVDFMNTYPTSQVGNDFMTRWAIYANTPMSEEIEKSLMSSLRPTIKGKSQLEAVERLLNFVQTAFVYEYDNKVWGGDRAFFAEESLFYPYTDCEDRSILFSRLVRDLVGLDVALIYYPGHLATAVHFTDNVTGDYLMVNGRKFIICDPTYIGAPVGSTMPKMDNSQATAILLKR